MAGKTETWNESYAELQIFSTARLWKEMTEERLSEWKDAEQLREDLSIHHLDLTMDDQDYHGPFLIGYPLGYSKSKAQKEAKKHGVERMKYDGQMAKELEKWHRGTPAGASAAKEREEDNEKEISRRASELNGT